MTRFVSSKFCFQLLYEVYGSRISLSFERTIQKEMAREWEREPWPGNWAILPNPFVCTLLV